MISIENLRFNAIRIRSLSIRPGVTSVIGPNGSGKTSLLKLLAGIVLPDSGSILIDGTTPRKTETGWINEFPDRNILFETVADEIASPLRFRRMACKEVNDHVDFCMETLGITRLRTRLTRELSGGEKVLVALATALVHHPRVLILDECDSHLDADWADSADHVIRKSDVPYIIRCTQDMERAACGDCLIYLENGTVRFSGNPESVFASLADTSYYPFSWKCAH